MRSPMPSLPLSQIVFLALVAVFLHATTASPSNPHEGQWLGTVKGLGPFARAGAKVTFEVSPAGNIVRKFRIDKVRASCPSGEVSIPIIVPRAQVSRGRLSARYQLAGATIRLRGRFLSPTAVKGTVAGYQICIFNIAFTAHQRGVDRLEGG